MSPSETTHRAHTMTHYRNGLFDSYVCPGDTATIEDVVFEIRATIVFDEDSRPDDWDSDEDCRKSWKHDEWFFCGVVLSLWLGDVCVDKHAASLWGLECNYRGPGVTGNRNEHLNAAARELLGEAREVAKVRRDYLLCLLEREYA